MKLPIKVIGAGALRQLAYIRYMQKLAGEQASQAYPLSVPSLNMYQDAIESALLLICECLQVQPKQKSTFHDYLNSIHEATDVHVPHSQRLNKLNKARVSLKHHGIQPAEESLSECIDTANDFFRDAPLLYLGVNISEVSTADFIVCQSAREKLKEAEEASRRGDYDDAITAVALSFHFLIDDYWDRKRSMTGASPLSLGPSVTFPPRLGGHIMDDDPRWSLIEDYLRSVSQSVDAVRAAVSHLSLGLDYRKYLRFQELTPAVQATSGGPVIHKWASRFSTSSTTSDKKADLEFCIDFVFESAVHLQGFDYSTHD